MKTNDTFRTNTVEVAASRNNENQPPTAFGNIRRFGGLPAALRAILPVAAFALAALSGQTAQAQLSISPSTATVAKGDKEQFTATYRLRPTDNATDVTADATWSVSGNASASTTISGGLLTVASDEINGTLTVNASYKFSPVRPADTKSATVTVSGNPGNVVVETLAATGITQTAAVLHGKITSDGGSTITGKKIHWRQQGHGFWKEITSLQGNNADFYVNVTGLTPATTYEFYFAATDSRGEWSGSLLTFTTVSSAVTAPVVETLGADEITQTTAKIHGRITSDGNATITFKALLHSRKGSSDPFAYQTAPSGSNSDLYVTVTNLQPGTTYQYKIKASNSAGSTDGNIREFTTLAATTVTSVTVTPSAPTVAKGSTQLFTATVVGTNSPPQSVTWKISGDNTTWTTGAVGGNSISNSGLLTVAAGTALSTLYVKAASTYDDTKAGYATVTLSNASNITGVTVSPVSATVAKGSTQQFTATVQGANSSQQSVTWYVSADNSTWSRTSAGGCSISDNGVLTVSATAGVSTVYVKAVSDYNTTKSATATVTITAAATPVITISSQPQDVTKTTSETKSISVTASVSPAENLAIQWYKKAPGETSWSGAGGTTYPGGSGTKDVTLGTGLQEGTHVYYAKIYAVNNATIYVDSRVATVTVTADAADNTPPMVSNPAVTVTAKTHNSITVSWAKATDAITPQAQLRYRVHWDVSSASGYSLHSSFLTDATSFTMNSLQPNTTYKFYVNVYDEANNTTDYNMQTATTDPDPSGVDNTPPVISNVQAVASNITAATAIVQYTLDEQAKVYQMVYLASASAPSAATVKAQGNAVWKAADITMISAGAKNQTVTGLSPSTAYKFYIVAEDAAGNTSAVASCAFTTASGTPTVIPPTVETLPATGITQTSATLHAKITNNGGGTITQKGFQYAVKGSGSWYSRPASEITGTDADYALPLTERLQPATTYEYKFYARNSAGVTESTVAEFTTLAGFGVDATSLSYTAAGGTKYVRITASLNWTAVSSATWLTVTPASGTGNETLNVVAAENTTSSVRTATLAVTGGSVTHTVNITQAAGTGVTVTLPTVETLAASGITATSATLGGRVTNNGGEAVSFFGITYKKKTDSFWNTVTSSTAGAITGTASGFSRTVTGLDPDSEYEFIAIANNSAGQGEGAKLTFRTPTATAPPSGNNALSSLSIEGVTLLPAFSPSVTSYTASVPNAVASLNVSAQAEDGGATVGISGDDDLQVGDNTVSISVTAANGSARVYTVIVTRAAAPSALETVASAARVWAFEGVLYVSAPRPATLQVYTLAGVPAVNRSVAEGQTVIPLPRGFYIVRLGNHTTAKVFVK
jgi:hypothetical protein